MEIFMTIEDLMCVSHRGENGRDLLLEAFLPKRLHFLFE